MADQKMTPAQVAARLGVSERTLQRWRKEKTGPAWGRSGARFHYRESVVQAWECEKQAAMQDYLTIAELAALLELSENTLAMWRTTGKGPQSTKINGRVAYHKAGAMAWAVENGYQTDGE